MWRIPTQPQIAIEALLIMDVDETRRTLFDGHASKGQTAKLVVRCGGDENRPSRVPSACDTCSMV